MVKPYYDITIRDYNLMEKTGKLSQFNKSLFPTRWVKARIQTEINKLIKEINLVDDSKRESETWRVQSLAKINALEANYLGIINILGLGSRVAILSLGLKKKINLHEGNIQYFIGKIKEYTGIEIKSFEDIQKVKRKLTWLKDKFNENFPVQKQEDKRYLMSIVLGVFSYLNQPINMDMTVIEFKAIWDDANEKRLKENARSR